MAMNDYSLSDIAAVTDSVGNGNGGFGDGNGWWILLLFILLGWGGNRGYGYQGGGAGNVGGNELYPWMENQQSLCNGFANVTAAVTNGFANAETAATARQMANMNQQYANTTAMMQGFSGVQAQTAQLASDIQLGNAQQTATILAENCADRAALSDGVRDIIANQTAGTQRILDQMCQDKIDEKNDEIAQLRQQVYMKDLAASQQAQNNLITQGFANEVDALYNRLNTCPVPSMPVYGRTPIFTCQPQNQGCGCGSM